jgi:hypothetical protein
MTPRRAGLAAGVRLTLVTCGGARTGAPFVNRS